MAYMNVVDAVAVVSFGSVLAALIARVATPRPQLVPVRVRATRRRG